MNPEAETDTEEAVVEADAQPVTESAAEELPEGAEQAGAEETAVETGSTEQEEEDPWAEALAEQLEEESAGGAESGGGGGEQTYTPATLDVLENEAAGGSNREVDLELVLDIPVTIAMEIGRTKINVRSLLQLNQGSVVELDRLAGEPLDVMVNGTLIAHGEVVVVNEKFGIRLTDVVSAQERLKNLKK